MSGISNPLRVDAVLVVVPGGFTIHELNERGQNRQMYGIGTWPTVDEALQSLRMNTGQNFALPLTMQRNCNEY